MAKVIQDLLADRPVPTRDSPSQAKSAEERYDWTKAAGLYEQALNSRVTKRRTSQFVDLAERIAFCHIRAAFQAQERSEFLSRLRMALESYQKFAGQAPKDTDGRTNVRRNRAVYLYFTSKATLVKSWIAEDSELQTKLLSESVRMAEEAFKLHKNLGWLNEAAKCCGHLLLCLEEIVVREPKNKALQARINSALFYGRSAIEILASSSPTIDDDHELCRIFIKSAWFCSLGSALFDSEQLRNNLSKMKDDYLHNFKSLSEKLGDSVLLAESLLHSAEEKDPEQVGELAKEILPLVLTTKDNLLIAGLHAQIAYGIAWAPLLEENPDKLAEMGSELQKNFNESTRRYGLVRPIGIHWEWLAYSHSSLAQYLFLLSRSETDLKKREELLDRILETGKSSLDKFGPYTTRIARYMEWAVGVALKDKAALHQRLDSKVALLEEALNYASNFATLQNELEPHRHWDCGMALVTLANVKFERSNLERNAEDRTRLLKGAIETSAEGVKLLSAGMKEQGSPDNSAILPGAITLFLEEQDGMWSTLYQLTREREVLTKRLEVLQQIKDFYNGADLASRIAEAHWEMGSVHSLLRDHLSASRSYEEAAEYFVRSSKNMPQLQDYYTDFSLYMKAWAQIEKARASHDEDNYSDTKECYGNASQLLENSKAWNLFASHYKACAYLEDAEGISRVDGTEDVGLAIREFREAKNLFAKSHEELSKRVEQIENSREREGATALAETSLLRENYCKARIHLEEGRLYYREGKHSQSIHEYSSAVELLEKLAEAQQTEWERKEIETMVASCKAWQTMQEAESKASSELYKEAAKLFMKALEAAAKERVGLVASGNVNYCMALSSMLRFKESWQINDYLTAKSHLTDAISCFSKAGFQLAAEWFTATERMLDAYVYINNALKEVQPDKRVRSYLAAEKLLELSVGIYEKGGYPARRDEVLLFLKKIKEERELTISLGDVFAAPTIISSPATFSIPTPARDEPVGLSEFQGANVQIALSLPTEIRAEEAFQIKLDLINTGKQSAVLYKIENLVPKGLRILGQEQLAIKEDGTLDLQGKRLRPLQMETISFTVIPKKEGETDFSPKVYYSDERGSLLSNALTFTKLGILPVTEFKFKSDKTAVLFNHLVDAFVEDYMEKKYDPEIAGRRTLVEIAQSVGLAPSTLYGREGRRISPALDELVSRGLVGTRIYPGERGRGGAIMRLRIAYERDAVKGYVNRRVRTRDIERLGAG